MADFDGKVLLITGSATGLGAAALSAWFLVAYDARGANQTALTIKSDAADNPAGTFANTEGVITMGSTEISGDWFAFTIRTSGRRYYRLYQLNADRGGGHILDGVEGT